MENQNVKVQQQDLNHFEWGTLAGAEIFTL